MAKVQVPDSFEEYYEAELKAQNEMIGHIYDAIGSRSKVQKARELGVRVDTIVYNWCADDPHILLEFKPGTVKWSFTKSCSELMRELHAHEHGVTDDVLTDIPLDELRGSVILKNIFFINNNIACEVTESSFIKNFISVDKFLREILRTSHAFKMVVDQAAMIKHEFPGKKQVQKLKLKGFWDDKVVLNKTLEKFKTNCLVTDETCVFEKGMEITVPRHHTKHFRVHDGLATFSQSARFLRSVDFDRGIVKNGKLDWMYAFIRGWLKQERFNYFLVFRVVVKEKPDLTKLPRELAKHKYKLEYPRKDLYLGDFLHIMEQLEQVTEIKHSEDDQVGSLGFMKFGDEYQVMFFNWYMQRNEDGTPFPF